MVDVNEEIVAQYIKIVRGWLYATDILFPVRRGYSNIDILAYDPKSDRYYDIEVKYRSAYSVTATNRQGRDVSRATVQKLVDQFVRYRKRNDALIAFTNGKKATKVLVTTRRMIGVTYEKRQRLEKEIGRYLSSKGFPGSEVWYFDNIIPELAGLIPVTGRYNTELLQTIRMIKTYLKVSF